MVIASDLLILLVRIYLKKIKIIRDMYIIIATPLNMRKLKITIVFRNYLIMPYPHHILCLCRN